MTYQEKIEKVFQKYIDSLRSRSVKWSLPGNSFFEDMRIRKFIKFFAIPIELHDVLGFIDTTTFRTGKEGYLFTREGVVIKEVANKLYYLKYEDLERAEIEEIQDEYYNVTTLVWAVLKNGERQKIFDFYVNRTFFVAYLNDVIAILNGTADKSVYMDEGEL